MGSFPSVFEGSGSLAAHILSHKAPIDTALAETGAVLLRGFHVPGPDAFDAAVAAYGEPGFTYAESLGNAVCVNVTERVFTANEAPPATEIYLHHEKAQTPIYPGKLFFYCQIAPDEGGATPLCPSHILFDRLQIEYPENAAAFEARGVRYANVMPGADDHQSGQGRSTLGVTARADAEARLQALGYTWEWREDDSLRAVIFGDDEPITQAHMAAAIALSDELTYDHAWQAGDVVLVDNYAVMHGRRPFAGQRRVLASLIS